MRSGKVAHACEVNMNANAARAANVKGRSATLPRMGVIATIHSVSTGAAKKGTAVSRDRPIFILQRTRIVSPLPPFLIVSL